MFDGNDVPRDFPCLRVGSLAHIFADPPECSNLEGPALLLQRHGQADDLGFEPWSVVFSNSCKRELRYVHPFDLIFTLGPAAAIAATGEVAWPASITSTQGGSHGK